VKTLYLEMDNLVKKIESRIEEGFYGGFYAMNSWKLANENSKKIKKNFTGFYNKFITYVKDRYDFSESNYHKSLTCLHLQTEFKIKDLLNALQSQ
jgi:hypothetical protein